MTTTGLGSQADKRKMLTKIHCSPKQVLLVRHQYLGFRHVVIVSKPFYTSDTIESLGDQPTSRRLPECVLNLISWGSIVLSSRAGRKSSSLIEPLTFGRQSSPKSEGSPHAPSGCCKQGREAGLQGRSCASGAR